MSQAVGKSGWVKIPSQETLDESMTLTIVPTRNALEPTRLSIESCLAQTVSVACLVVDNASDDSSFESLERIYRGENRIAFYRNKQNLGRVGNWNRGLDLANYLGAGYVRFLFSGDQILPSCQEECEEVLRGHPGVAAIAHDYLFATADGETVSRMNLAGLLSKDDVERLNYVDGGFLGSIVANVYSMKAIGRERFNENLVGKTDFDFRILRGQTAYYLPKVLSRTNLSFRRTFASAMSYWMVCEDSYVRAISLETLRAELPSDVIVKAERQIVLDLARGLAVHLPFSTVISATLALTSQSLRKLISTLKIKPRPQAWRGIMQKRMRKKATFAKI